MTDYLHYDCKEKERVRNFQHLLNNNSYRRLRKPLVEDGDWGPLTSAATQDCKYWLGYPKEELKPIAGKEILGYLTEEVALPGDYQDRRKLRIEKRDRERDKQTGVDRMRLRVLKRIKGELGTLETPNNSNHIRYNDYWGWGPVPYCMIGVSWSWLMEGSKAFVKGSRWAGCREMLADAQAGGHGIHLTHDPDPGCPGVVNIYGDARPDHAVTFVRALPNGLCETYEFNTSKDSSYIQGVWSKTRRMADCWWFEVEE